MTTLQTRTRLSYLDNLRVVLTALVVLHHAAVTYSHIPLWYYYEAPHDGSATALDVFLALNQAYFMGFFFLIAGYFTPGALDRKGAGRFARDRLVRLGIPLLLFVIVVRAVVGIPGWSVSGLPYAEYYVLSWDPGPTWFLEVLLVFSLVYALVRRLRPDSPRSKSAPTSADRFASRRRSTAYSGTNRAGASCQARDISITSPAAQRRPTSTCSGPSRDRPTIWSCCSESCCARIGR